MPIDAKRAARTRQLLLNRSMLFWQDGTFTPRDISDRRTEIVKRKVDIRYHDIFRKWSFWLGRFTIIRERYAYLSLKYGMMYENDCSCLRKILCRLKIKCNKNFIKLINNSLIIIDFLDPQEIKKNRKISTFTKFVAREHFRVLLMIGLLRETYNNPHGERSSRSF